MILMVNDLLGTSTSSSRKATNGARLISKRSFRFIAQLCFFTETRRLNATVVCCKTDAIAASNFGDGANAGIKTSRTGDGISVVVRRIRTLPVVA